MNCNCIVLVFFISTSALAFPSRISNPSVIHNHEDPIVTLSIQWPEEGTDDKVKLQLLYNEDVSLEGETGPYNLKTLGSPDTECSEAPVCKEWSKHGIRFTVTSRESGPLDFKWTLISPEASEKVGFFETCFTTTNHVYGAGEQFVQNWPIEGVAHPVHVPYVTADFLSFPFQKWGGVSERYWLMSNGATIFAEANNPLFFTLTKNRFQGSTDLCYQSKYEQPYKQPGDSTGVPDHTLSLNAGMCVKDAHYQTMANHFELPTGIPDERMMTHPVWSTWAEYKADINKEKVLDFASNIRKYGFTDSQLEIDDDWETCYGSAEFDQEKFPDIKELVDTLKNQGFRVTLWIHPFINEDCKEPFEFADKNGFLVKDSQGKTSYTKWWNSRKAGIIDATNPDAVKWWTDRLEKLRSDTGIDSFKFDAGETNWLPEEYELSVDPSIQPQQYTTSYVDMVQKFGNMIEVRVGFRSQKHPVFVRMLDKSSNWGHYNGLQSMIPTALQMSISGYPFVLPDMIGGNGYGPTGFPSKELYIRWAQLNAFLPAMQISIVPWYYDDETVKITKAMVDLHIKYSDKIIELAKKATQDGTPIIRPLWWADPHDPKTHECDDEFLVGDDLLVAPVVTRGTKRDIYIPSGNWTDEMDETHPTYEGPTLLENYKVELHQLPYFTRLQ